MGTYVNRVKCLEQLALTLVVVMETQIQKRPRNRRSRVLINIQKRKSICNHDGAKATLEAGNRFIYTSFQNLNRKRTYILAFLSVNVLINNGIHA